MAIDNLAGQLIGPLTIESLANGGKGIARERGRVVFIPGAFPGDVVLCRLSKEKKNYAEGEVVELQRPSSLRRPTPCPVAEECGGCQWQQLPYDEQLNWKQKLFTETLTRQVGVDPALVLPIVPAPEEFGYRSRVQVKCFLARDGFIAGFFRAQSRRVVDIATCPLMHPQLNLLLGQLRKPLATSSLARHIPQLDLSIGSDGKRRAVVHYHGSNISGLSALLLPIAQQYQFDLALQVGAKNKLQMLRGDGDLQISVDRPEISLAYAAGGFAQVNLDQNRNLVDAVLDAAKLQGNEQVLDLYCGMGNFSLPLARRAGFVTAVEDYLPSIEMARRNAVANGIKNVVFHAMPAEQSMQNFKQEFDLLLLDPPRAGAYPLVKQLLKRPVGRLIYISCDQQTLARDLKLLVTSGYQLESSRAFDMFPQTYHLESVSVLSLA